MPERAEFHPQAGRMVTWLLALLAPSMRSDGPTDADGLVTERVDLVVRQCGAQVAVTCTQRVENRSAATIRLCWTVPQPPVASAHTVGVRVAERVVSGHAFRVDEAESDAQRAWHDGRSAVVLRPAGPLAWSLAAGWLPQNQALEVTSHHFYAVEPSRTRPEAPLHVQLDAALRLSMAVATAAQPAYEPRALARRTGCQWVPAPDRLRCGRSEELRGPALLTGVLARLARHAAGGFVFRSAAPGRAVVRGLVRGCAVRLLLAQSAVPEAPRATPRALQQVERLLRAYCDPVRAPAERARLARDITNLGLQCGLVTPWTALLAAGDASGPEGEMLPARIAAA